MDDIREIIHTLDKEDIKDFKTFINRLKKKDSRKDLDLFNVLQEDNEYSRDELLDMLYPEDRNLEAYHATRKRLIKQLNEYIYTKRIKDDTTSASQIMGLISMSQFLFEKLRDRTAWKFLKKAEELAEKSQQYALLNNIYSIQVEHSQSEFAPAFTKIIQKKAKNQKLAVQDDNANTAYQVIKHQLNIALTEGKDIPLDMMIKKVLADYELTQAAMERPKLMFNIVSITRSAILAKKDFYSFEPYIIALYNELKGGFDQHSHPYKVNILYFIAHALYRNKKFLEAERYLDELYASLLSHNKSQYLQMIAKYTLLKSAVLCFSNKLDESIEELETFLGNKKLRLDTTQVLNTYINLSVYYFLKKDYNKALRVFQNVHHSDAWLTKKMGREWLLRKHLIEILGHFEMGNIDVVESRIRTIERSFGDFMNRPMYQRVRSFIKFIKVLLNDPSVGTSSKFQELVEGSLEFIPTELEDLQAMMFYGWVKSKMVNGDYYQVLLDLVQNANPYAERS